MASLEPRRSSRAAVVCVGGAGRLSFTPASSDGSVVVES